MLAPQSVVFLLLWSSTALAFDNNWYNYIPQPSSIAPNPNGFYANSTTSDLSSSSSTVTLAPEGSTVSSVYDSSSFIVLSPSDSLSSNVLSSSDLPFFPGSSSSNVLPGLSSSNVLPILSSISVLPSPSSSNVLSSSFHPTPSPNPTSNELSVSYSASVYTSSHWNGWRMVYDLETSYIPVTLTESSSPTSALPSSSSNFVASQSQVGPGLDPGDNYHDRSSSKSNYIPTHTSSSSYIYSSSYSTSNLVGLLGNGGSSSSTKPLNFFSSIVSDITSGIASVVSDVSSDIASVDSDISSVFRPSKIQSSAFIPSSSIQSSAFLPSSNYNPIGPPTLQSSMSLPSSSSSYSYASTTHVAAASPSVSIGPSSSVSDSIAYINSHSNLIIPSSSISDFLKNSATDSVSDSASITTISPTKSFNSISPSASSAIFSDKPIISSDLSIENSAILSASIDISSQSSSHIIVTSITSGDISAMASAASSASAAVASVSNVEKSLSSLYSLASSNYDEMTTLSQFSALSTAIAGSTISSGSIFSILKPSSSNIALSLESGSAKSQSSSNWIPTSLITAIDSQSTASSGNSIAATVSRVSDASLSSFASLSSLAAAYSSILESVGGKQSTTISGSLLTKSPILASSSTINEYFNTASTVSVSINTPLSSSSSSSTPQLPNAITPATQVSVTDNYTVITIGFKSGLNYPFVVSHSLASAQIFQYLPGALTYALGTDNSVAIKQLVPFQSADLDYIVTVAEVYYPKGWVDQLRADLQSPVSKVFFNPDSTENSLVQLIDINIPLVGLESSTVSNVDGQSSQSGSTNSGNTISVGSAGLTSSDTGSFDSVQESNVEPNSKLGLVGTTSGISAAAYISVLLVGYRIYKKKKGISFTNSKDGDIILPITERGVINNNENDEKEAIVLLNPVYEDPNINKRLSYQSLNSTISNSVPIFDIETINEIESLNDEIESIVPKISAPTNSWF